MVRRPPVEVPMRLASWLYQIRGERIGKKVAEVLLDVREEYESRKLISSRCCLPLLGGVLKTYSCVEMLVDLRSGVISAEDLRRFDFCDDLIAYSFHTYCN